jgi:hypothetical protein
MLLLHSGRREKRVFLQKMARSHDASGGFTIRSQDEIAVAPHPRSRSFCSYHPIVLKRVKNGVLASQPYRLYKHFIRSFAVLERIMR